MTDVDPEPDLGDGVALDPLPDAPYEDGYPTFNLPVATDTRRCAVCRATYSELENIGRWRCRMHPGTISDGRFSCCGLKTAWRTPAEFYRCIPSNIGTTRGCVPCDHRVDLIPYDQITSRVIISEFQVAHVWPREAACHLLPAGDVSYTRMVAISRTDPVRHAAAAARILDVQVLSKLSK